MDFKDLMYVNSDSGTPLGRLGNKTIQLNGYQAFYDMTFEVWSDAPRRKIIRDIGKFYEFLAERYPRRVRAANAFSYTKKKIPGGAEVNVSFGIARRTVRKKR